MLHSPHAVFFLHKFIREYFLNIVFNIDFKLNNTKSNGTFIHF